MISALLLAAALTLPTNPTTLVLRNGDWIDVQGGVREENGIVVFRAAGGTLYSLPLVEVDLDATRTAAATPTTIVRPEPQTKLKVSAEERERLLRELERNHSGTAAPVQQQSLRELPPPTAGAAPDQQEEWSWRQRARAYEEAIRQAHENRDLLVQRAESLRGHIAGLIALGYKPSQFTYDTSQLQYVIEQIPYADLEVTRAKRAYEQFRDDARRQGILPGWLR